MRCGARRSCASTLRRSRASRSGCSCCIGALLLDGAGFRRRDGAVRHGLRPAVPRGRAAALRARHDGRRRGAAFALLAVTSPYRLRRLTAFLDPWADPLQQRLPAHPVADRDRPRRMVRRGARRERAEALLSAGGAHRFPVRGAGRGAGPGRRGPDARAVPRAGLAQLPHRAARIGCGAQIPVVPRRRVRAVARHPGVHQHRREHGRAADQGTHAAADELWALEPDRDARLARAAAARVSRGDGREPRLGERTRAQASRRTHE